MIWGISLLVGLLAALALSSLFGAILVVNYYRKLTDITHSLLRQADQSAVQIEQILQELNQYQGQDCTSLLLDQMRGLQFQSNFIKDIGFLQGRDLICTTGIGLLSPPFTGTDPDLIGRKGYQFWFYEPLELFKKERNGHIIRYQNFNTVISDRFFDLNLFEPVEIGIYMRDYQGLYRFIEGSEVHKISHLINGQNPWRNYSIASFHRQDNIWNLLDFQCGELSPLCISAYVPLGLILLNYRWELTFGSGLILSLSILLMSEIRSFLRSYFSFENCFLRGFKRERFICLYQPIVAFNASDSTEPYTLAGLEVLCRWLDQDHSWVSPQYFLPLVRKQKKTLKLTRFVLENLYFDLQKHQDSMVNLPENFKIAINIFPSDFSTNHILGFLEGLPFDRFPLQLCFELTEDDLVHLDMVQESIATLQQRGYSIAIDDFGVGYCNLSYLQELNADFIKIDKIFIDKIEENTLQSQLLPLIIEISRQVGAEVIAEGIETTAQAEKLLELGVHFGQGYYFGKPMPLAQIFTTSQLHNEQISPPVATQLQPTTNSNLPAPPQ